MLYQFLEVTKITEYIFQYFLTGICDWNYRLCLTVQYSILNCRENLDQLTLDGATKNTAEESEFYILQQIFGKVER